MGHFNLSSRNFGVYSTVRHTFYFDLLDSHLGGIVNGKEQIDVKKLNFRFKLQSFRSTVRNTLDVRNTGCSEYWMFGILDVLSNLINPR